MIPRKLSVAAVAWRPLGFEGLAVSGMRAMASGLRGVFLAAILYAFAGAVSAQETVIVGAGGPAAEVHETNIFDVQRGSPYRAGGVCLGLGSAGGPPYAPGLWARRAGVIGGGPEGGGVAGGWGQSAADSVRIQYGGSVKPVNAPDLMMQPDIDGLLVGGASLDPDEFARIVAYHRLIG